MNSNNEHTNRLKNATSPYLLQHAHNPVDWFEWGDEAWETAKKENKPVLISIGYSACHWCHVMAHESFEDHETAELMNRFFINIKVDREERPDVDMVYMDACQLITGRGGWPLNVICLPDQRPIHAGTYFPRESWQQVLLQIHSLYSTDYPKMLEFAKDIEKGLTGMNLIEPANSGSFKKSNLPAIFETLSKQFDYENGGPNRAPKFPMPNNYEFLLDYYQATGDKQSLDFVHLTLLKMANGGIYDPIRGGFCRYSTDKYWFAPHFEKMLYDNAQLTSLYARAFAISDAPLYKELADEILEFCMRELRMENGGYYSALDADSDGIEGRFYVFTDEELQNCLTTDECELARIVYGCKPNGNWEHNFNILHKPLAPLQILEKNGLNAEEYFSQIAIIKQKLFEEQNTRNRPGLDDKIITGWNGLMLEALANSAKFTNNKNYLIEAQRLAEWIWNHLQCDGKLWRIYSAGKASVPAFSEDYACLISGFIALFEADQNIQWLKKAEKLADVSVDEFFDSDKNIFYLTGKQNEKLIQQKTDINDDVISSSNSIFCTQLQKLGVLLDRNDLAKIGTELLNAVRNQVQQYPGWYSNWCRAAQMEAIGLLQVECTGPDARKNHAEITKHLPSWTVTAFSVTESELPVLKNKFKANENQIFICAGNTCFEPVSQSGHALEIINEVLGREI